MTTASDNDDLVLNTPGFGSTIIEDSDLQSFVCQTWHDGIEWDNWDRVADVIAGVHDLFHTAGVESADNLMEDLEFLRATARTHRRLYLHALTERIDQEAMSAAG